MIDKGALTVADRRHRVRLAVEAGNLRLAQAMAAELPGDARITAKEFVAIERDPARTLAKGRFNWKTAGGRDLALYALERASRSDAVSVRSAWESQRSHLPEAERRYGNARIAFHAARQLAPKANDWYREARGAPLDDNSHAWRVRAALRAGSWPDVLSAVDAMPPALAREASWRYWKARALASAGKRDAAAAIHGPLSKESNFYGLLAAEAMGAMPVSAAMAGTERMKPTGEQVAAFGQRPGVKRAVKLARMDLRPESIREWASAIRGLDDNALLVAAEFARQNGLYDRAINTAERTVAEHDFEMRYLMPYRTYFTDAARDQAVDPAILLGVARQESRFSVDIVSSAGAMGLMQLMPQTARWVAKQLNRSDYAPHQIGDVSINTQFGAFYFKYCLDKLERLPALAAAAYNAGPSRAQAWRIGAPLEGAIWVETIPFNETRDYVKKVLANTMFYSRQLDQPYVALTARLGTIPPRGSSAVAGTLAAAQTN